MPLKIFINFYNFLEQSLHPYNHLLIISDHYEVQEFFGDIFSANQDVFYSTRPFAPVFNSCGKSLSQFKANLLDDYFHCRLKNQSYLYKKVGFDENTINLMDVNKDCFKNNFCFRFVSFLELKYKYLSKVK